MSDDSDRFGFPQAQPAGATSLQHSWASDDAVNADLERELRDLFVDLFESTLGERTFDASVLGAPHLGTFDLVRKTVNTDGLVLLRNDSKEPATRYLYRAWRSEDVQGRGLHFLRTYLQMLMPNSVKVHQLWHDDRYPYGSALIINQSRVLLTQFLGRPGLRVDGAWQVGAPLRDEDGEPVVYTPDPERLWLTSRLKLRLNIETASNSAYNIDGRSAIGAIIEVIRAVIPARLVPEFLFWLAFELRIFILASSHFWLIKNSTIGYPWCGRSLSNYPDRHWTLGVDGHYVSLPEAFGTFRVGERRGQRVKWRLLGCRIDSRSIARLFSASSAYRLPNLGETDRRLDRTWALGRRQADVLTHGALRVQSTLPMQPETLSRWIDHFRVDYPATPRSLDQDRTLDGFWRLGERAPSLGQSFHGRTLDGWSIGRKPGIITEITSFARKAAYQVRVAPVRLAGGALTGWPLGGFRLPKARRALRKHVDIDRKPDTKHLLRLSKHIRATYPSNPQPLTRLVRLGHHWQVGVSSPKQLGAIAKPLPLSGWPLAAYPGIRAQSLLHLRKHSTGYVSPWVLNGSTPLDGRPLGEPLRPTMRSGAHYSALQTPTTKREARLVQSIRVDYPASAHRLARLQSLDGLWRLRQGRWLSQTVSGLRLDGRFVLPRSVSVITE